MSPTECALGSKLKQWPSPNKMTVEPNKKIPLPESASELYGQRDHSLSVKLVTVFADVGCHVVSLTDPYSRNLDFLDLRRYFFFKVAL
jgi:hypothetical protein